MGRGRTSPTRAIQAGRRTPCAGPGQKSGADGAAGEGRASPSPATDSETAGRKADVERAPCSTPAGPAATSAKGRRGQSPAAPGQACGEPPARGSLPPASGQRASLHSTFLQALDPRDRLWPFHRGPQARASAADQVRLLRR